MLPQAARVIGRSIEALDGSADALGGLLLEELAGHSGRHRVHRPASRERQDGATTGHDLQGQQPEVIAARKQGGTTVLHERYELMIFESAGEGHIGRRAGLENGAGGSVSGDDQLLREPSERLDGVGDTLVGLDQTGAQEEVVLGAAAICQRSEQVPVDRSSDDVGRSSVELTDLAGLVLGAGEKARNSPRRGEVAATHDLGHEAEGRPGSDTTCVLVTVLRGHRPGEPEGTVAVAHLRRTVASAKAQRERVARGEKDVGLGEGMRVDHQRQHRCPQPVMAKQPLSGGEQAGEAITDAHAPSYPLPTEDGVDGSVGERTGHLLRDALRPPVRLHEVMDDDDAHHDVPRHLSGPPPRASAPLRVLVVAPFDRGLDHGGSQRATAVAERLEERGASVDWHTVKARDLGRGQKLRALARLEPSVVAPFPRGGFAARGSWDVALAAHSYLAPQLAELAKGTPRVLDFHNLEWRHLRDTAQLSPGPRRPWLHLQSGLMRGWERRALRTHELSLLVSEEELEWARQAAPQARMVLAPSVLPRADESAARGLGQDRSGGPPGQGLVYVGTLTFPPNLLSLWRFLTEVWPALRSARPALRLTVAGRCLPPARRELARVPGVEVRGFVADLRGLLRDTGAVVLPFAGAAGTSLRALFLALARVPMIGTPQAFRGLPDGVGSPVSTREEWVRNVVACLCGEDAPDRIEHAAAAVSRLQGDPEPWDQVVRLLSDGLARGGNP